MKKLKIKKLNKNANDFVVAFQSMLNTYHSLGGNVFKTKQIRKFMVHVVIYYEKSENL
jgi:hypothetical protein